MANGNNQWAKTFSEVDWKARFTALGSFFVDFVSEIYHGIRTRTMPFPDLLTLGCLIQMAILFGLDSRLYDRLRVPFLYPSTIPGYHFYWIMLSTSPIWGWTLFRIALKRRLLKRLTDVFIVSGLKNNLGGLPGFVSDRPIDHATRRLRVTRALLPKERFDQAKAAIESGLQVYIDEIKEDRCAGTIDMLYSKNKMPHLFVLDNPHEFSSLQFAIGTTRSARAAETLRSVPHLLIAGQTKSGKSTFLRQLITSLYLCNKDLRFTLIDLKGGLEFQLFERLPRVDVVATAQSAIEALREAHRELSERMEAIRGEGCQDIDSLVAKMKSREDKEAARKVIRALARRIIVIDEAAEVFLAGPHLAAKQSQEARRLATTIAAQGRAVGIHLVIATQRPDKNAVDTLTKANLQGRLCFAMADNTSSMTILDNVRAADLPAIPGRAIWKNGINQVEVQTPLLTAERTKSLLDEYRVPEDEVKPTERCRIAEDGGDDDGATGSILGGGKRTSKNGGPI